ncbi:hypothetical protein [Methanobacterium formicicum]|uniref:hypothetical protein n=1 Tax=Methanobacterium formicicum TaxID=2162 RepID=UPI00249256C1|nr:hypothetical protein [Methanobacterium formicicum]
MNRYLKIILFGFLIWLIPFVVSFFIYPLKTSGNPLFESIMPLALTIITVLLACTYLKSIQKEFVKESILIGVTWFLINIIIDLIMFLPVSPMQMTLNDYMADIGITYLIIPVITMGMGYLVQNKAEIKKAKQIDN